MKKCIRCGIEKSYDKYHYQEKSYDKYQCWCKECHKSQKQQHRLSHTLPYWIVYQLPNADNYVGKTNNPNYRMALHRYYERDTSGWIELHRFDTEKEARVKEAEYHDMGYPGNIRKRQHRVA